VRTKRISAEFRNDAVECLRLASQVTRRRHKALLMDLARAWICIAEQVAQTRAPSDHLGLSPDMAPRTKLSEDAQETCEAEGPRPVAV
jgi:hypothetical protein